MSVGLEDVADLKRDLAGVALRPGRAGGRGSGSSESVLRCCSRQSCWACGSTSSATWSKGRRRRWQAPLLNGASFDLAASSASRPVLVYFWASWCPVCRLEQGSVSALLRDHPVVTVAMQSGSAAEVSGYLREHGLDWPVINDPDGALAARWGVRATPTFFVVDRERAVRFREVGYTSGPGLRLRLWLAR
ncbi:MAG: protein disulfide oxidoreductase [Chromatiales bacterium]|nr:protein disulfide oxidoreductase [Chromatiales bacterium]